MVQGEDRLKAFPERLKLPGYALVQGPVHHQLHREGRCTPSYTHVWLNHICTVSRRARGVAAYPEVLLQVVDGDGDVLAPLLQLDVGVAGQGEVQAQVLHGAAVHVQALQALLQGLPRLAGESFIRDTNWNNLPSKENTYEGTLKVQVIHILSEDWWQLPTWVLL